MARYKSRNEPRRADKQGEASSTAAVLKSLEGAVRQWVPEAHALLEPGQFDPVKAGRLKMEMDVMMLAIQRAQAEDKAAEEREYSDWLEANIPEMFRVKGRPHWIESASQDKALLIKFDERLNRTVAQNAGKKHGASKKVYADLADEYGVEDVETVKQRVMRARRRQKALQETLQDIQGILARSRTRGDRKVPREESKKNRQKLLEAFRRIVRTK
jgi:hypothetical protein